MSGLKVQSVRWNFNQSLGYIDFFLFFNPWRSVSSEENLYYNQT